MPYTRLDDTIVDNLKTVKGWAVDPGAFGLDTRAIAWCGKHLTDGFFPDEILDEWFHRHGDELRDKLVGILVASGRWEPADGGYELHDYLEHNPSKEEVEKKVAARKAAGSKGGKKSRRPPSK